MKQLWIIIDGMEDEPIPSLSGKTPAQVAEMPALNFMRTGGKVYYQQSVPPGVEPATDVALLNILGYEITPAFSSRSWFEAIGNGINVSDTDLCIRCNLISHKGGVITSHCGDNLAKPECEEEMLLLQQKYNDNWIHLYSSGSFRNILVIKDCNSIITATPPHNLIGKPIESLRLESDDKILVEKLNDLVKNSFTILSNFPANGIALWSPGKKPQITNKLDGKIITGVPLVKGIAKTIGMEVPEVEGATGDEFTNLFGKLRAAQKALNETNFVILHIEAPDEISHQRDWRKKIRMLERIDREILMPIINFGSGVNIRIQADHATSSITGQHLSHPVEVIEYTPL